MKSGSNPQSRRCDIVIQEIDGEVLIYDLAKNKAFCLNQTSAMIWQTCDGTNSITEISQNLSKRLRTNVNEDIVWLAVSQFKADGLLEKSTEIETPFDGMNRREIVKRIGFASMIALPVIASVVAPTAINAQSVTCGCNGNNNMNSSSPGCPCNSNSDCCNNVCGGGGTTCAVSGGLVPGTSAACCPTVVCPPSNGTGIPPGCSCNGNANCATGICTNNICSF